jgi:hypothetical protein
MDKKSLVEILECARNDSYSWALYFFKIDRRNNNPYTAYKIRFKNGNYLPQYTKALIDMIIKCQLGKIAEVKDYTGENTKVSCDKIETNNELMKKQWDYFVKDIADATDERVKGKYHGYVLEGISTDNKKKTIDFLKLANPVINLKNKRSVVFSFDSDNELDMLSDEVCKLYMNVDCIVVDETLYSFNYKFEDLLNIEKTMKKLKSKAVEEIVSVDAFENREEFVQMAKAYKSPRTFITLKKERIERIKNKNERRKIASMLKIDINDEGKFILKDEEEASLLIRYLCFKVFKDDETKELLEANNVTLLSI